MDSIAEMIASLGARGGSVEEHSQQQNDDGEDSHSLFKSYLLGALANFELWIWNIPLKPM